MASRRQCAEHLWLHVVKSLGTAIVTKVPHNLLQSVVTVSGAERINPMQGDPKDMEEWQFALEKEVAYKDVKNHHAVAFEASQKMEALEWMKARQHGSMNTGDGCQGEDALSDVLPDKAKSKKREPLALMDKMDEESEQEPEKTHSPSKKATALHKAVEDAEVLSDLGRSKSKDQAAKRVQKMIKLIKDVKGTAGNASQKALQPSLSELEKVSRKGNKLSLETCKDTLLDAALALEKVQKGLQK